MLDFGFYNMDCMEGMKEFPDKYFDLAIVDPPYGDPNGGGVEPIWSTVRPLQESTSNKRIAGSQTARGVIRTGGTWASKYRKKSLRGTLPRKRNTLTNFFVSHVTRLSGGAITLNFRPQDAF